MTAVNGILEDYEIEAESYSKPEEAKKAIKKYTKIIEGNEDSFDAYIMRGLAYIQVSNPDFIDKALEDFIAASEIPFITSTHEAITLYLIGFSYQEKALYDTAIRFYTTTIELEPEFVKAYNKMKSVKS